MRYHIALPFTLMAVLSCSVCIAADSDGDGIRDAHEKALGTDPQFPEQLEVVNQDGAESQRAKRQEGYDATKDVLTVEFAHVAEDRCLWRATFAQPPHLDDTVFHIYVDADANQDTGRPDGYGVEYMLSVVGGSPRSNHYSPDGQRTSGPLVSFATDGNALLVSADVQLGRDDRAINYRMWVLCHTTVKPGQRPQMTDSTGKFRVEGITVNDREKIIRPQDYTDNHNVTATFGLDIIRPILRDERTTEIGYRDLQLDGFSIDMFTSRRYPHVQAERHEGRVSAIVQKPGTHYIGFMMYDDHRDDRVAIYVNDDLAGVVVANKNNNRHWLYCLSDPRNLQTGDVIALEALGSPGGHGICSILLLSEPPTERGIQYAVENTRWVAPVNTEGRAWISWTTTWPSSSRFEYGPTDEYGNLATEDCNRLGHRARLENLQPGVTYHGRGVGIAPDGTRYYGPDIAFTPDGIEPPPTKEGVTRIPLTVRNPHHVDAQNWPVTNGVPFPKGALATVDHIRLIHDDEEVLAQFKPLGTWPDGSIKWVLVTTLADVPAGQTAEYTLEFGRDVSSRVSAPPLARPADDGIAIDTGAPNAAEFLVDDHGRLIGTTGHPCATILKGSDGETYRTASADAEVEIEENGPVRAVIRTTASLADTDANQSFRIEKRLVFYRNNAFVRIYHTFLNDRPDKFTNIQSLTFSVRSHAHSWRAPLESGDQLTLDAEQSHVWQRTADQLILADTAPREGRLTGTLVSDEGAAVSVRHCWQQYPKGFRATEHGIDLELCPPFDAGFYDDFPFDKQGHHLYYYLLDGHYRFRQGMAKTHELLIDPGTAGDSAAHCTLFQKPLLLTPDPQWTCTTGAFYDVAPRDQSRFAAYEKAIDKNLDRYADRRERQNDYGIMNYGDWYGERGSNWGNIEYDTQHAFLLEYIRSGNPEPFYLGEATEIHNRDIDTIHWSPDGEKLGAVYVHQMCHVGGYYDRSVPDTLGFPQAGYTVSHAWTEGHFDHYFLTGDPRSLKTGRQIADYFANKEFSRPYDFLTCRVPGWQLIMNAAALAATNDPYYLNASRIIVDRVLATQDVEPRELPAYQKEPGRTHQTGGWSRMMRPGHCRCEPRHRGNAGFMVAVLLSGLKYYYDVTEDPDVKQAIIAGAHYLLDECYSDEVHGFRYTSCPETDYRSGATPLMVEGIARAYRWTHDDHFEDVLTNGLAASAGGSAYGKGFSMYYRCAPRLLADLAAVGLTLQHDDGEN